ncbi:hypothetical protein [Azospirillum brasilense]|uniref:Uncharacterized protein n=1 Tax=Azospirillum brasilense TaxID=192 RepID=A0A235HDZ3_AZOBR|nr:hypothetical protein [Azospirillum brasilense]OYD83737.1 hypothetical protein CHT98_14725 [Azospirillum brasilense]
MRCIDGPQRGEGTAWDAVAPMAARAPPVIEAGMVSPLHSYSLWFFRSGASHRRAAEFRCMQTILAEIVRTNN